MKSVKMYNSKNQGLAKMLRSNATSEENKLWYNFLSKYSIRFYRQRSIGKYIVDFYCPKAKLVIEIDGAQHYEQKGLDYDKIRTQYLENLGLTVLRFVNSDINKRLNNVCSLIDFTIKERIKCNQIN